MHKVRSVFALLQGQMSDWLHSPRTLLSSLIVLALTYMNAHSFAFILESDGLYSHFGECVFYYLSTGFGNVSLVSALFLVMMAEIPRRTLYQNAMLIRATRLQWLMSQIMFCFLVTMLMLLSMLLLSVLMTLPSLTPGSGWSDLERLVENPNAKWMMQLVPEYVRIATPLEAGLLSVAVLFAFWFTMILVILFCTLINHPNLGIILYASLLVLQVTILWEELPVWMRYMPVDFSTLSTIGAKFPEHEWQAIPVVLAVYTVFDALIIWIMYLKVRTMDLFFAGKDADL